MISSNTFAQTVRTQSRSASSCTMLQVMDTTHERKHARIDNGALIVADVLAVPVPGLCAVIGARSNV